MAKDGREAVVDDIEEPTDVSHIEREVMSPCAPCGCSGSVTVAFGGRREKRLCPGCRGFGFRMIRFTIGRDLETGSAP